jgi:hypothetical protein
MSRLGIGHHSAPRPAQGTCKRCASATHRSTWHPTGIAGVTRSDLGAPSLLFAVYCLFRCLDSAVRVEPGQREASRTRQRRQNLHSDCWRARTPSFSPYQQHDVYLRERPKQGTVPRSATSGAYKTAPSAMFLRVEHLLCLRPTPEKCSLALDKTTTPHGVWQRQEGRVHLATFAASSRVPSCRGPIAQVKKQRTPAQTPAQTSHNHYSSTEHPK